MAVAKHLEVLERGALVWNAWRKAYPKLRPGLTGARLDGRDLGGMDFKKVNLSGSTLAGADLQGCDLGWADLSGADLRGATLSGASLLFADLTGTDLRDARGVTDEQLGEAVMDGATRLPGDRLENPV